MRLPIIAFATALLVSIVAVPISAQTAFGVLNVWLKARESADAPNDQQVTLYQKSKALVAYLVPADAPSPKFDAEFRSKAISLRRFGEYMREARARHVLAIFDSCFSGGVFNVARSLPPPAITLATTQPVREFISSGEAEQQVSDDGTFRTLFLDVLAGKEPDADANHDGYVTGTELGLFLHQKMTNLTNNRQTPRYGKLNALGYDRGDFVFQVGKPEVPSTASSPAAQSTSEAERAWADAKNTNSLAVLESFIKRYGDSFQGDLARARLEDLKKNQVAVVAPPVAPSAPAVSSTPCGSAPVTESLSSRLARPLSAAEECALKPKDVFKECDKCPEMIVVPSGSFPMGSASSEPERVVETEAQVRVTIPKPFAVGEYAVTFDEWDACVADGGCGGYHPSDQGWGYGRRPVINVSWDHAQKYVSWISGKTGKTYRLLSEAEREYVTRAGTTTPFWWGSSITPKQTNYDGTYAYNGGSKGEYRLQTVAVDSDAPNPWGSITSMATCGSGCRTAGTPTTTAIQAMAARERAATAVATSFAAVPGSTVRRTSARPAAAGTPPSIL